jgi:hypothetical protein
MGPDVLLLGLIVVSLAKVRVGEEGQRARIEKENVHFVV